jgi:hypothetical protein
MRKALRVKKRLRPNEHASLNASKAGAKPLRRWATRGSYVEGKVW